MWTWREARNLRDARIDPERAERLETSSRGLLIACSSGGGYAQLIRASCPVTGITAVAEAAHRLAARRHVRTRHSLCRRCPSASARSHRQGAPPLFPRRGVLRG